MKNLVSRSVNLLFSVGLSLTLNLLLSDLVLAQNNKPVQAIPVSLQELEQRLTTSFKASKVTGASVALIENGTVVLNQAYGRADLAGDKKVSVDTVFRAGSISKSVLGIAVMLLVEEGKLDLNAKLADLVPEISFSNPWETTDPVRVVHLLEHTSGFDALSFHQMRIAGPDISLRQSIALYGPYVSRWKPGSYFAYCDSAPVIAAYIVEKISGQKWAEFTRQRIFGPLGMESAYWERSPVIADRLAKSYREDGVTEEAYVDIPGKPVGALNVSAQDLAKLMQLLIGRGTSNGVTLLKPESIDRIETPSSTLAAKAGLKIGYGLGNMASLAEKSVFHGHNGSIDGFMAIYNYEPKQRAGYVLMINSMSHEALQASELITAYLERTWPIPATPTGNKADGMALQDWVGYYESIAPTAQWLAPLERPMPSQVLIDAGLLQFNDIKRIAVAPGVFQRPDRPAANLVFVDTPDGTLMLTNTDASRRISSTKLVAKTAYAISWILALLITSVLSLLWAIAGIRGRLRGRVAWLVRLVPAAAIFIPLAFFICLVAGLADPVNQFGTSSPIAYALLILSLLVPVASVSAIGVSWTVAREVGLPLRLLAWANSLLALAACFDFWRYGWLGLRTWM